MASLLSCPPELRQQILSHCLPADVHNAGVAPRTGPLLPLLLTCKTTRLDVLQLLRTWSPLYHIEDPAAITNPSRSRCRPNGGADEPHMRRISLRLFARLDLKRMRASPLFAVDDTMFDAAAWLRCVDSLPRAAVHSVVVDLTPVPSWMVSRRPDWVRSTVLDGRNRPFLNGCASDISRLVAALEGFYGAGVPVLLGGVVARKAKNAVEAMMVADPAAGGRGAGAVRFAGEWLSGPVENPTRLSLVNLCRCWGIRVGGPTPRSVYYEDRMNQVLKEARKEGLTAPELKLGALGQVCWSKNSCTAYYVNAQEDEGRARETLVRLLAFAVEVRTGGVQPDATVDFEPAVRERRFLLHCLAKDLGLASVSVGDAGEKFVRVSCVVEAAAAEIESLESGGEGGEEDLPVQTEEDLTSSSSRATSLQRPSRSCCGWAPIQRLFGAAGDR